MKLSTKIKWVITLLILLTAVVQIWGTHYIIRLTGERLIAQMNEEGANNQIRQLRTLIDRTENSLKHIAQVEQLRTDKDKLDLAATMLPDINALIVTDDKGVIVNAGNYEDSLIGQNVAFREYFQGAMQGKTVITGVFQGLDNRQVIAVAVPIKESNGSIAGVVAGIIWIRESHFADLFENREFGRNGSIAILDSDGTILYHPNKEIIGNRHVAFESFQQGLTDGKKIFIFKDKDGKEYYSSIAQGPKTHWIAVVQTPVSELEEMQKPLTYGVIITLGIMTILFLLISTISIGRITKPLSRVTQAFASLRVGKYNRLENIEAETEDDIKELVISYNETVEELEQLYAKLSGEAQIDGLTGIYNRKSFNSSVESLTKEFAEGLITKASILLIDLDYFKRYNDTQGHLMGDELLKSLAQIMTNVVGGKSAFRYGGDEFAVVLRGANSDQAQEIGERIRVLFEQLESGCSTSIGIASMPDHSKDAQVLLDYADKALYTSKLTRNKVTLFEHC
ncbi:GGDEF domain-containing protein [Sporomusaceae bacterium FL31]|nr:GGDEF domain-containing protein [Sporomusaceae bacterium FL31]GCE34658.1 GGDEF domain-containing protein [Sporomusaceae bacterium]